MLSNSSFLYINIKQHFCICQLYGPNHLPTSLNAVLHQGSKELHLAGALMEHFLEGIAPLRHWYISLNLFRVNLPVIYIQWGKWLGL